MKSLLVSFTALLLVPPAVLHAVDAPSPARKSNILLILSDDHSVPHVGCYGNPDIKTPNLDKFAAQGLRCDCAYVTCPQCVPSRASIFTGPIQQTSAVPLGHLLYFERQ